MASKIGPALGILVGGLLVAGYGWRSLFLTIGAVSLLWLMPWGIWGPKDRALMIAHSAAAPGILEILSKREAWGTFFGLFGAELLLVFPAHLAAVVSGAAAPFFGGDHGQGRVSAIFHDRGSRP